MKKVIVMAVFAAALLGVVGGAMAQVEDEIALTRKMVETGRQAIVAENLGLTDEQGKIFWPLFRDYNNERAKIGDRATNLIAKYAASYKTMDDASATALVDEYMKIQKDDLALRNKWLGKMRKVLPGALVARYFQIENKLDAYIKAVAADEIPLMSGGKPVTIAPEE